MTISITFYRKKVNKIYCFILEKGLVYYTYVCKGGFYMAAIIDITSENFAAEVTASDKPVLVDFWAVWCGPCQMMAPIIHELAEEMPEVKVGKINVDEQMELARQYRVMSIPTMIIFRDGQEVKRIVGVTSKGELKDALKN